MMPLQAGHVVKKSNQIDGFISQKGAMRLAQTSTRSLKSTEPFNQSTLHTTVQQAAGGGPRSAAGQPARPERAPRPTGRHAVAGEGPVGAALTQVNRILYAVFCKSSTVGFSIDRSRASGFVRHGYLACLSVRSATHRLAYRMSDLISRFPTRTMPWLVHNHTIHQNHATAPRRNPAHACPTPFHPSLGAKRTNGATRPQARRVVTS